MKSIPVNKRRNSVYAVILFILLIPFTILAQEIITLEYCYQQAEKNYPLRRQLDLLGNTNVLKVQNLNKSYLPQINVNGSASLQSDVTEVAIALPAGMPELSMPQLSKDWYKLTLDVNQAIYDGNLTRYQKKVEAMNLEADRKAVEIELYKLKDRINQIYFSIILLQQNMALLKSNQERIGQKLKEVASGVKNGAVLQVNADLLQAELIRIDQQTTETLADRSVAYKMLSELISTPVPEDAILAVPEVNLSGTIFEDKRLEYELFNIQRGKTDLMGNMVTTKWNPKVFAFGQLGYGRPGLNMLDDSFRPWWLFGAKVTWNPWNWNHNKNEKEIFRIQNDMLRSQQETFDKNLKISSQKELSEVMKFTELLSQDNQMIALREKITKTASSQLDNGVITSSDYIARLNEETISRLNLEIHKIQLVKAKLTYLYTLGKL